MGTREVVDGYFRALRQKNGWQSFLSDAVEFRSFTAPVREVSGKGAFVQATARFYSTISTFDVLDLLVDGTRACARTRYQLQPPNGAPSFQSDVAEVFTVEDGKISDFAIYFDSAPFPK